MGLSNIPPINGGGGGGAVDSVFGRTGVVTAQLGDYTTDQINEGVQNKFSVAMECHNATGVTLTKGTPVYVVSTHASGKPIVDQADNSDPAKMPCVGVIQADILDGADGFALTHGPITNVDTSAVNAGEVLYVGTVAGDRWVATKPTGTALIQNMGYVLKSHATSGSFEIQGSGRNNDLPNLAENKYWVGDSNGVPQQQDIPGESSFTKYSVGVGDSPFTIPMWDSVIEVHNDTGDIELILPAATANDQGKELKLWVEHNPSNHKVLVKAASTSDTINNVANDGAEVARAEYSSNQPNFFRVTAQAMGANEIYMDQATSVYNQLRYVANFTASSDFSPYSYFSLSAIPSNFMTSNADWWFAVKVETPMTNDSDGQVLFGSNNFFVAYRGNGTYFMTSSTSGYLQTISPTTIIEAGDWIIYQHDSSANTFEAWVNGVKVLNGTTSGATPPLTAPTDMWFGSEEGQALPPSGYGYPLQQCRISNITIGSGNLTDSDIPNFTTGTFRTGTLVGLAGAVTNEWTFNASAPVTQVGAINLTANGSNLSFEEI
jgi:hypothetical protein